MICRATGRNCEINCGRHDLDPCDGPALPVLSNATDRFKNKEIYDFADFLRGAGVSKTDYTEIEQLLYRRIFEPSNN